MAAPSDHCDRHRRRPPIPRRGPVSDGHRRQRHPAAGASGRLPSRATTPYPNRPFTAGLLAAIPEPDPEAVVTGWPGRAGEPPSPVDPPSGYRFRTAAPAKCADEQPGWTPVDSRSLRGLSLPPEGAVAGHRHFSPTGRPRLTGPTGQGGTPAHRRPATNCPSPPNAERLCPVGRARKGALMSDDAAVGQHPTPDPSPDRATPTTSCPLTPREIRQLIAGPPEGPMPPSRSRERVCTDRTPVIRVPPLSTPTRRMASGRATGGTVKTARRPPQNGERARKTAPIAHSWPIRRTVSPEATTRSRSQAIRPRWRSESAVEHRDDYPDDQHHDQGGPPFG